MSINDPVADMLTRIRNGLMSNHTVVAMPSSNIKAEIARILREEGYIEEYDVVDGSKPSHKILRVHLKYVGEKRQKRSVITELRRVSKPGRRIYTQKRDIPWVLSGMGISILSTPKGVMTGKSARKNSVGGEILCKIW